MALIVAIPPKHIQNQIDRLMKKWIKAVINLSHAIKTQNHRADKKWTNYLNNIVARRNQLEYPYSRVTSDCFPDNYNY